MTTIIHLRGVYASDEDYADFCVVDRTPSWTVSYTVKIVNHRTVYNDFRVLDRLLIQSPSGGRRSSKSRSSGSAGLSELTFGSATELYKELQYRLIFA